MKKTLMLSTLFIILLATSSFAEEVNWVTTYDAALKQAGETGKPIMIDFYTDWCGWCKRLDKDTYTDAAVVKKSEEFINAKIHAEKDKRSAKLHGVSSFPTIVFLDSNGKEIWRVAGYKNGPQFLQEMVKAQVQTMSEELLKEQADAGDAEAAYFLALKYSALNDCDHATTYYDKSTQADQKNSLGYKADSLLGAGLCLFQSKEYDAALENYNAFLEEFKEHSRLDEALYFAGFVHLSLNDTDIANSLFAELTEKFPKSGYTRQWNRVKRQFQGQ